MLKRRILLLLALPILGALFLPLLYHAVHDLFVIRASSWDKRFAAQHLVEIFDTAQSEARNAESPVLALTLLRRSDHECGEEMDWIYEQSWNPRIILAPGKTDSWTELTGLMDLESWQRHQEGFVGSFERGKALSVNLSGYSIALLGDCIGKTAFSAICRRIVARALGDSLKQTEVDTSREKATICVYLDGVAARHGLPLAGQEQRGRR